MCYEHDIPETMTTAGKCELPGVCFKCSLELDLAASKQISFHKNSGGTFSMVHGMASW